MNQKVEEFLTKAKAEETKQAEKEKRRILISAGLFEKETVYGDSYSAECPYYDNEKKILRHKKNPVDVTEEEYAEILKYTTAKKDKEDEEEIKATPVNDGAENAQHYRDDYPCLRNYCLDHLLCNSVLPKSASRRIHLYHRNKIRCVRTGNRSFCSYRFHCNMGNDEGICEYFYYSKRA